MERWTRFGDAIGAHMAVIAIACVAVGVAFPEVFSPLETIVPFLFACMTFQGSLNNTMRQVLEVFRHPTELIVILVVVMVGMPVLARLLAGILFADDMNLVTGIVLEYSVPVGVVSFMWVGMYGGNGSLGLAAILVSTVLAPFSIPITLQTLLGATVHVDVVSMMVNMIFMIALPALAGMVVNDLTHGWGRSKLSPALSPASKLLLIVIITSNSTGMADSMRHLTPELVGAAAFILVFAVSGYLWGFLAARALDRPLPDLVTICFDCGLRNISSGAVIAAAFFPGEVMFPVMCGTLFQQVIAAGFGSRMRALVASEAERNEATCERARLSMTSAEKTADDGQGSGPKE